MQKNGDVHSSLPQSTSLDIIFAPHHILHVKHSPSQKFHPPIVNNIAQAGADSITTSGAHCEYIDEE